MSDGTMNRLNFPRWAHTGAVARILHAIELAAGAHHGQTDKAGEPYLWHVLRVGTSLLPDVDAAVAGILHDVLEDCPYTADDLAAAGVADPVIVALRLLCRDKHQPYEAYIAALAPHPLARKVKLADLADNLDPRRLAAAQAAGCDTGPLQARYRAAVETLRQAEAVDAGECLSEEVQLFNNRLPYWLGSPQYAKWAVIQGQKVLGFFDTWQEAVSAGTRNFGIRQPFLVRQVLEKQPTYFVGNAHTEPKP